MRSFSTFHDVCTGYLQYPQYDLPKCTVPTVAPPSGSDHELPTHSRIVTVTPTHITCSYVVLSITHDPLFRRE